MPITQTQTRATDMPEDRHVVLETRFNSHIEDYRKHLEDEHTRWNEILIVTENNNKAIDRLTASTQGLVDLTVTGKKLAEISVWFRNVSLFAVVIYFLTDHFNK